MIGSCFRALGFAAAVGFAGIGAGCGEWEPPSATSSGPEPTAAAPSPPDLASAMRTVFPEADAEGKVAVPPAGDEPARVERAVALIPGVDGRSFLVTARERTDMCHACSAAISVFYLQETNGVLSLASAYRDLYESGGWGEAGDITPLNLRGMAGLVDESGFTAQGCTATNVTVYLFEASGPKLALDRAPLGRSQDAIDIGGTIVKPHTQDVDFAINYVGNDNSVPVDRTVTWKLDGGALMPVEGIIPDAVAAGC